ncbi:MULTISPECIES: circadian clock KaiB family protein [Bradyrhizobium]|uniref:Circadian clock protein KaiB n=1 Tax=Bradyrhizobium betae TaxID=244734 RepID=A0AAE9N8H9_9BRAD|nr:MULTISPECIES: circadian clock KaiB family protein [Bradyrhizobium]MDD1573851.1 circadian clock protein KaiB [Bradyrhizobium sp. WBOS1]UUO34358.1 circadian clock protein KaiB [Bradyrhizobium sp. WBOS01]MDD1530527.1 circadian clock protein KaiB [Bradyrhizobium sp. WBOS2]MDD1537281.1 circadian clock protein KaiB [Bradyrhizobium sp. WBOS8]MDD1579830.1 circadian clock protein KaiB [Bradyrhizobium sp. WBOS7]
MAEVNKEPVKLVLYVAGETPKSLAAIRNLEKICSEHLAGKYRVEVVDLKKQPQLAREHGIVAIPTLVKELPVPIRKIIGDLSDTQKVLVHLSVEE